MSKKSKKRKELNLNDIDETEEDERQGKKYMEKYRASDDPGYGEEDDEYNDDLVDG